MPVNFNLLRQAGPANFAEGLMQGQEESRKNALAQQQAAENQQLNALRMQQSRGAIAEQEATAQRNKRTEKASMFRERLLRAATPDAARQLVIAQYNDPDLAPVLSQAGSLEQALAEVSDDPAAFEQYKQQEAMGMGEWIKSQAPKVIGNALVKPSGEVLYKAPEPMVGDAATMRQLGYPLTPEGYASFRNAQRQERLLSPEEEAQRIRLAQAGRAISAGTAAPKGYRYTPTGDLEPIPGGPAIKPEAAEKPPSVSEQNSAYNINRVLNAATEIKGIVAKDPDALAPGSAEAAARAMGMEGTANAARSSNRQIVYGAQRDALDALLYLATGAAYNKEQLQGAWDAYMPSYTDDKATRDAKQTRLGKLLETAKVRAGKAWTPEMDTAMKSLSGMPAGGKPASPAAKTVTRTGTLNGRKVVQYSDGSTEYAD